jgi:hypothetical protein
MGKRKTLLVDKIMAFIDWLRRQQEESARNTRLFQGRPLAGEVPTHAMVAANRVWGGGPESGSGYQDRPGGESLMVRQPIRRQSPPPTSVTLTEDDTGSRKKVTKWEPDKQEKRLKATALPSGPAMGAPTPIVPGRVNPAGSLDRRLNPLHWGRQNPNVPGSMGRDPGWAGVPRARPQRNLANMGMDLRPRLEMPGQAESLARIPRQQMPPPRMPRVGGNIGATNLIGRQQAAIPRQQMPPPRFVPPVDSRQFPTVQDRGLGTYNTGEPGVQMGGGFDWTGRALRENVGEDFRNIGESYTNWWQNLVEENKRRRQRGNY